VWNDLKEPPVTLDIKELEDIFTVDTSTGIKARKSSDGSAKNQSLTTLLDITRANNVGESSHHPPILRPHILITAIMLARIKLSKNEIRMALLEVEDTRLSTDDLRSIARQLPTQDEVNRLRDFGDLAKLSKSDQYFGEVSTLVGRGCSQQLHR